MVDDKSTDGDVPRLEGVVNRTPQEEENEVAATSVSDWCDSQREEMSMCTHIQCQSIFFCHFSSPEFLISFIYDAQDFVQEACIYCSPHFRIFEDNLR